jgi:hypothetical protein
LWFQSILGYVLYPMDAMSMLTTQAYSLMFNRKINIIGFPEVLPSIYNNDDVFYLSIHHDIRNIEVSNKVKRGVVQEFDSLANALEAAYILAGQWGYNGIVAITLNLGEEGE